MIASASSVLKIKINNKQKHEKFNPPRIVSLTSLPGASPIPWAWEPRFSSSWDHQPLLEPHQGGAHPQLSTASPCPALGRPQHVN